MSLPQQIGHFKVLSELGRGGMGIVYKVKNNKTGALAALKMIPPEALSRSDSELRFKREFRAMQRVEHPNVIRVFDAGTHEGCPYFTMELVEGAEIRRFVDGETPIVINGKDGPPNQLTDVQVKRLNEPARVKTVADLVVQVAFALAEIHSHRIVHRDLKPDNIIVSRAGVAKLMDFGIAKQLSNNSEHSSGGMVVGTFKYLSPEQALGGEIDGRADLYCLGIILYELLTGRHPFYSESSIGYAYHHAKKPPPDIDKFNPGVNLALKAICDKLIKKDPRDRYATAEDLIAAIREAEGGPMPEASTRMRIAPKPVKNLPFALAKDQVFAPALVGRDRERKHVGSVVEKLLGGRGGTVVISGPSGIGKTRLLREAQADFKQRGADFVWGRCEAQGGPYHPYIEALEALLAEVKNKPADELRRLLGDDGPVLARYLPSLETIAPAVRPKPKKALEPQGERLRFIGAVTSFLSRMSAQKSRVVVIDDVHLADELSLSLTRHLWETAASASAENKAPPIALALAFDPKSGDPDVTNALSKRLAKASDTPHLMLTPLPPPQVTEMLASMLGGGEVAQALGDALHHATQGVPGAVEERVRAWVESGELRRAGKGRGWAIVRTKSTTGPAVGDLEVDDAPQMVEVKVATRWDIPVPDLESPNKKRIGRLGDVARDVADRVAVIGERVPADLLERAALRPQDELIDALDELIKRDILMEDEGGAVYRFVDLDDRKALLEALPIDKRQNMHLLAARAVTDYARRHRRPQNPDELSRHYLEARDIISAIEQLMASARIALSSSATQTAAQRVREAQELLAAEQKAAGNGLKDARMVRADVDLVLLRLDVLAAVNEHRECVTLAQRRLPRMHGTVDGTLIAEMLLRLAASERVLGDLDAALEHTGQVLTRTERGGSHALRCRAKGLCGLIYEQRGNFDLAERYFNDALELAHTIGDEIEEERARWSIASRRMATGALDEAKHEIDSLLQSAQARGEKLRVTQYVNALGVMAHERGDYGEAEASYRRMIELAKPAGDRRSLASALTNIAVVRRDTGDFDEALNLTTKAAKILVDLDQVEHLAYLRIVEAQILLDRAASIPVLSGTNGKVNADNAAALKKADEALDMSLKAHSALKVAEAAIVRGLAMVRKGDPVGKDEIERGMRTAMQVNANRITLYGLLCDAEAKHKDGNEEDALRAIELGKERARRTDFLRYEQKFDALKKRLRL